jgi:AraC-like DNA-binding protein
MVEAFQGDVIMANPGEIHDGLPMAGQTRIWQMIYLDPSFILGALSGEATSSFEIVHPVATDAKLARYIKRLFVNLLRPDADPQFRDESLLETLMQMRTRHTVAQCEPESRPCLAKALERLDSTPDTGVSLAELASVCGLSRFQFLRAFRAAFNITPHAYLMQKRTGRAKALLARGVLPVEAAVMSGFADQSHLTRNFLRQFGITPARYAASIR